jgi:hypothetical protein
MKTEVSSLKRILLVLGLALALSLVFVGSAFANFGPHGGYATDTDSCAGCHRAHSSFSTVKFTPKDAPSDMAETDKPYALLVGSAQTMQEFCYACHGDTAPGASTNVQSGVFDGGPSGANGQTATGGQTNGGVAVTYVTESTFGAPLNGGGFGSIIGSRPNQILDTATWEDTNHATQTYKAVSSAHTMEGTGQLWGAGQAVSDMAGFTCTNCHDPHGSSNYRLLRDTVNGNTRGGYIGDVPNAYVLSTETNYPVADGGWLKHDAGATQMGLYKPNYTSGSTQIEAGVSGKSMSAWCAGCHEQYDHNTDVAADGTTPVGYSYAAFEGVGGAKVRHRHPVDITLQQGDGILEVAAQNNGTLDQRIPLEVAPGVGNNRLNHVGCLTCHFAHGSTAAMSGWSNATLVQNEKGTWVPQRDNVRGVSPDKVEDPMAAVNPTTDQYTGAAVTGGTSALLRADNRGVCERCHNK